MSDTKEPRRVVKVGGSLFDLRMWIGEVERWIGGQPEATTLLVLGGGPAVDMVAYQQSASGFSDAEAHWQCIAAMGVHARSWAEVIPEWRLLSDPRELDDSACGSTLFLDAEAFMSAVDAALGAGALPESWDVSSDSIAARAAELFGADELVLLKSTLPSDLDNLGDYVDPYFVEAARRLQAIRFVNLRDPGFAEVRWR